MHPNRREIKLRARGLLRGAFPAVLLPVLIYLLLVSTLPSLVEVFSPSPLDRALYLVLAGETGGAYRLLQQGVGATLFLSILLYLFQLVLSFGLCCWALEAWRGETAGTSTLLEGFGMVGRVLMLELQVMLRSFGWIMLMSVPLGFIVAFFSGMGSASVGSEELSSILVIIFVVIIALWVVLRYLMVHFSLAQEPEQTAAQAVRRGVQLLRGHRWAMLGFVLSFTGWYLLLYLLSYVASGALLALLTPIQSFPELREQVLLLGPTSPIFWVVHLLTMPLSVWVIAYYNLSIAGLFRSLCEGERGAPQVPDF